ncbi:TetR/AcrR family transcriptional regulator C-terminal domain-containing protein [Rugosimonospora africana]|uniref:GntR family transcriptional regulator n=1 Tax=Rugosimonospora africana TaxID=556532 RepID=A0A8J3QWD4_9ACTN|nr:TetR/AcrR family transcriptional regulator C-terminal domain-containing protein [Rugosimonospora africana]GIH18093.1 GntR family transcriptional regulator [Rugosimonospora africana]
MSGPGPAYLRIVEEIRTRITVGELRQGDRIPSARQIRQEWGVAIATATKVHATLRQEGLTRVVPGTGTVVAAVPAAPASPDTTAPPRRRATTRESGRPVSRQRIVRAAIEIADAEGMAEVSMRRIASEFSVATMSLYRHVASKDDLIVHMIDAALGEQAFPTPVPEGWRAGLEQIGRAVWAVFNRHPWLAPAMSITRPQPTPNAVAVTDRVLHALEDTGLGMEDRLYVHLMLFTFVRGVATALEPEAEARRETGITDRQWTNSQEALLRQVSPAESPLLHMALQDDFDLDLAKLFEFGLTRLLDGIEAHLRPAAFTPGR